MKRAFILARSIARKLGLTRAVRRLMPARDYEEAFSTALLDSVAEGDVVWDIGANVGFYTRQFLSIVGPTGTVVAFEPAPESAAALPKDDEYDATLKIVYAALGDKTGTATMHVNADQTSPTNRIVESGEKDSSTVSVQIFRADDAWKQLDLPAPNVIKLDVEGFEADCISGMHAVLESSGLRSIFVEVHFGILAERGQQYAPVEIEKVLKGKGFLVKWVDASHIQAVRR